MKVTEIVKYKVFDNENKGGLGMALEADLEKISHEAWVVAQSTGKIVDFVLSSNMKLYLIDENNNMIPCEDDRFDVEFWTVEDLIEKAETDATLLCHCIKENDYENGIIVADRIRKNVNEIIQLKRKEEK